MTTDHPAELLAAEADLLRFCAAQSSRAFLLTSRAAVLPVQEKLPKGLLPFLVVEESSWPDVYAFDFSSAPPAVVVWCDHAIVAKWDGFDVFLGWARQQTKKKPSEEKA
jgi:hypothetical protein